MNIDFVEIINTSIEAGKAICKIYNSKNFEITYKNDNSPLTIADKKSNEIIMQTLLNTNIPIISEENKQINYAERKNWQTFWLVDPLDGTKEFIKKNGQFTVNIALIFNKLPVFGVIYAPHQKDLYFGGKELNGSYHIAMAQKNFNNIDELIEKSHKLTLTDKHIDKLRIIASKSHFSDETEIFINKLQQKYNNIEIQNIGSSLKFCNIAEGKAEIYPRFGPTMEWDIAAGHAIVKFAGGKVLNADTNNEMTYNKKNLLNPNFLVVSNKLISN
jgi:3'(2'), 5'-bisphosphate nucleotidase